MVLGLGCNTMATMTARIMATKKERLIVTLLLALGVPCSAQMGVILGMLGSLSVAAFLWWLGTVVLVMFLVGYLGNKIFRGAASGFVLEVPPIRRPQLRNIVVKTFARIKWYLKEAVPLFILGTFVLYVLDRTNALRWLERAGAPLVQGLLDLPAKATEAFIIGFLRRDYGAAGLYDLSRQGMLDETQIVVSLITITLFVPCIANVFVIAKERGPKTAFAILAFIFPFAFLVGGMVNFILRSIG
jgi:ferrous iron transport protein B